MTEINFEEMLLNFEKVKVKFEKENKRDAEIEDEHEKISGKIVNTRFNPNSNDLVGIYDIMDNFSNLQKDVANLWDMAMSYDSASQLILKTYQTNYKKLCDAKLISDEVRKGELKTVGEKNAYIDNTLLDYHKYVYYAEKQAIKSKGLLSRVKILSDLLKGFDEKVSRKVSVIQVQRDIGALKKKDD